MSDHGFRLRPRPKEGMNGLIPPPVVFFDFSPPPAPSLLVFSCSPRLPSPRIPSTTRSFVPRTSPFLLLPPLPPSNRGLPPSSSAVRPEEDPLSPVDRPPSAVDSFLSPKPSLVFFPAAPRLLPAPAVTNARSFLLAQMWSAICLAAVETPQRASAFHFRSMSTPFPVRPLYCNRKTPLHAA